MFGLIKKKLSSFVESITNKKRELEEPEPAIKEEKIQPEPAAVEPAIEPVAVEKTIEVKPVIQLKPIQEHPTVEPAVKKEIAAAPSPKLQVEEEAAEEIEREAGEFLEAKEKEVEKKELKPKIGLLSKIRGAFSGSVTIQESEVAPMLEELEIALLENDVSFDTASFLVADLRERLVGKSVPRGNIGGAVTDCVRGALQDLLKAEPFDLAAKAREKKPFVIMFIGPNGSGKTTTLAKIAHYLKKRGLTSVIAASDTFRAAAIHQAVEHGDALGVRVVKHDYGADPSAVAFDAIEHAKASGIDVVLVDTAGRQETNYNLVREMEKINRVVKPDLKIFVGEAIAGHALIEQVKKMGEAVNGIDGIILTKLDCDAKGGASLSVAHEAGVPVLFIGTGQEYEDFQPFDSEWFVERMLPENN